MSRALMNWFQYIASCGNLRTWSEWELVVLEKLKWEMWPVTCPEIAKLYCDILTLVEPNIHRSHLDDILQKFEVCINYKFCAIYTVSIHDKRSCYEYVICELHVFMSMGASSILVLECPSVIPSRLHINIGSEMNFHFINGNLWNELCVLYPWAFGEGI